MVKVLFPQFQHAYYGQGSWNLEDSWKAYMPIHRNACRNKCLAQKVQAYLFMVCNMDNNEIKAILFSHCDQF